MALVDVTGAPTIGGYNVPTYPGTSEPYQRAPMIAVACAMLQRTTFFSMSDIWTVPFSSAQCSFSTRTSSSLTPSCLFHSRTIELHGGTRGWKDALGSEIGEDLHNNVIFGELRTQFFQREHLEVLHVQLETV